ncbi:MAG: hypothetical protein U0798_19075 [Gemmataceae bacterium]
MKTLLGCLAAVLVVGNSARADEMDREAKGKSQVATNSLTAPVPNLAVKGSELDKESPDQSHGWRRGWGWGVGVGYGVGFGVGYSSGYYGGWNRPYYSSYYYSRPYYPVSYYGYYRPYRAAYYGGGCGCY